MTREEAIEIIKSECYVFNPLNFDGSTMINTALDMAIKALEQEPCEDAISRQSMLDYMKYLHDEMPEEEFIKALPSVTPTQKWIPVSERLPKITDFYLIQYSREICGDEITVAYYSVEEKRSDPDYEWEFKPHCGEYKEVIAWMPLPKAYEPQESEDKE
jgi:hypothetical protein